MNTVATDRVEQLARWLHEAYRRRFPGTPGVLPWLESSDESKERYRCVAEELIANPPACLSRPSL